MKLSQLPKEEYLAYYQTYLDQLPNEDMIFLLKSLKVEFLEFLNSLKNENLLFSYANGKWTVAEVLQHMIDTERIFQYRALTIARNDMTSLPGFDHDAYVPASKANSRSLESFINEFDVVRESGIALYKSFDAEMLETIGQASGAAFSPRAAAFISAGHQKHHLNLFHKLYNL